MALGVERRGSVAIVTLSAEAARNAFNNDSMQVISDTLNELMDDVDVKSIVITGTGKFFCAGADIEEFQLCIDEGRIGPLVDDLTSILHPLQVRMRSDPTILIAAINGAAAGGGLGLALACDARIACPEAKLAAEAKAAEEKAAAEAKAAAAAKAPAKAAPALLRVLSTVLLQPWAVWDTSSTKDLL